MDQKSKPVLLALLLLLLYCQTVEASEKETRWLVPRTNVTGPGPNDYECESARAPDYYGIGVRLVCFELSA